MTIRRLLDMTSGIPTFDGQPAFWADYVADPRRTSRTDRLIGYTVDAPATTGWSYSNTNYVLAEMVIERVTGNELPRTSWRSASSSRCAWATSSTGRISTPPR